MSDTLLFCSDRYLKHTRCFDNDIVNGDRHRLFSGSGYERV